MSGAKPTVLVTGATGYIASQMLPTFRERYDLRLIDMRDTDRDGNRVEDAQVASMLDGPDEEIRPLFTGADAVVHLAYHRGSLGTGPSGDGRDFEDEEPNVAMANRVYRLALQEGVRRVVVASSNHAADWYEELLHIGKMDMVDPDRTPPRSDNFYGWSKLAYESLGFLYASGSRGRKLGNVQIRIGAPRPIVAARFFPNGPTGDGANPTGYKRDLGAYISPRDLTQLFVKSIETPSIEDEYGIPFQVFYGISGNARAFWSIVNAHRVIGYAPQDDAELKFSDDIRAYLVEPAAGR
ncbi:MAG: NAD(P)-dependent oxidoreductase [Chloroflexi bacterium]|nr:NAD(P)-dependent oxidoreductase [Chloroflexota bacterium]